MLIPIVDTVLTLVLIGTFWWLYKNCRGDDDDE